MRRSPRTTWRGTPLHELWLEDPSGNRVEIYARLTDEELTARPDDLEPTPLSRQRPNRFVARITARRRPETKESSRFGDLAGPPTQGHAARQDELELLGRGVGGKVFPAAMFLSTFDARAIVKFG